MIIEYIHQQNNNLNLFLAGEGNNILSTSQLSAHISTHTVGQNNLYWYNLQNSAKHIYSMFFRS